MCHRNDLQNGLYQNCSSHNQQTITTAIVSKILAPLMAVEDVVVRWRERRTTLRTCGRRVLVVKDTLPCVLPHARRRRVAHFVELSPTPQYNKYKNSCSKRVDQIPKSTILNQLWNVNFAVWSSWAFLHTRRQVHGNHSADHPQSGPSPRLR